VCAHAGDIGGDPEKLLVGGVSAGGGLASSVVLRDLHLERSKGNKGRVAGQILCIPWLIYGDAYPAQLLEKREKSSYVQCAGAPVLPRERLEMFTRLLMLGGKDSRDPYLSVGNVEDEELKGMPKTALLIAGNDPLRDEGLTYAGKLGRKG
jgi:acetyl esterase/lipase